jgi:hypothetical protein
MKNQVRIISHNIIHLSLVVLFSGGITEIALSVIEKSVVIGG